jgi:DNA-binding transcriptional ArsR family regulator
MTPTSFLTWVRQKQNRPDRHIAQSDKIIPLLQQTGGMTRNQLGSAVDLDPNTLNQLLAALVGSGQITLDLTGGIARYRVVG